VSKCREWEAEQYSQYHLLPSSPNLTTYMLLAEGFCIGCQYDDSRMEGRHQKEKENKNEKLTF
jgi:hypothetical protein